MALASRAWRVVVPRAGGAPLKLAAGFAPLADGSCVASRGGTVVAASAVWEAAEAPGGGGGVPLSVEFRHGSAASGLVPATFNRRDPPRGGDAEVLAARVVDRALRPQICAGYDRLHVEVRVESSDGVHDPVVLGANAASAALGLSGARWAGPVGAVRVGRAGRSWAVDPAWDVVELGGVDVLWAGDAAGGATCVEVGASELEEGRLADALAFAAGEAAAVARAIAALAAEAGRGAPAAVVDPLDAAAAAAAAPEAELLAAAFFAGAGGASKRERGSAQAAATRDAVGRVLARLGRDDAEGAARAAVEAAMRDALAAAAAAGGRADGRRPGELRALDMACAVLPAPHGSAVFARGETRVRATATLGPPPAKRARRLDDLARAAFAEHAHWRRPEPRDRAARVPGALEAPEPAAGGALASSFAPRAPPRRAAAAREPPRATLDLAERRLIVHYEFPSYATGAGEARAAANRRAVGHGALAERALAPVFPSRSRFPYACRVEAVCLASAGSSSMATVAAASLALADAGVPLARDVAGVSVGLARSGDRSTLLLDLNGTEDHYGSMDLKVAGTARGVTAVQLDVKGDPVDVATLAAGLDLARLGRSEILEAMACCPDDVDDADAVTGDAPFVVSGPPEAPGLFAKLFGGREDPPAKKPRKRKQLKPQAPRVAVVAFAPARLAELLGPRGATLRTLEAAHGVAVDARSVPGEATIVAPGPAALRGALADVEDLVAEVTPGDALSATVVQVREYGAVLRVLRSREGLLHSSEYRGAPDDPEVLSVGDVVDVTCVAVDPVLGHVKLSRRPGNRGPRGKPPRRAALAKGAKRHRKGGPPR